MSVDFPLSGLYYPETATESHRVWKTALLLWDELQFIVPFEGFDQRSTRRNRVLQEAYDLIGRPIIPQRVAQEQVHEQVLELLTSPSSFEFLQQVQQEGTSGYEIYPQKLMPDTWEELERGEFARMDGTAVFEPSVGYFRDVVVSGQLGLLLMHFLAQACAGSTRRLITDQPACHFRLHQTMAGTYASAASSSSELDRVVTDSIRIVDPSRISFKSLLALRRAEQGSNGAYLRGLRRQYVEMIDRFCKERTQASPVDIDEIQRRQKQEMKDCLQELHEALKLNAKNAFRETCMSVAMVAAASVGCAAIALPAGLRSVFALNKTRLQFKEARRKAMQSHAMSWLVASQTSGGMTPF